MAAVHTPTEIRNVLALAAVLVTAKGIPMATKIAKCVGKPRTSVNNIIKRGPQTEEETPTEQDITDVRSQLWSLTQGESFANLLDGYRGITERWATDSTNMASDARDLRHLSQAVDINTKTLQLVTGGVTSRTQQNQHIETNVTIKVIEIPEKDRAAFRIERGLKEIQAVKTELPE